MKKFNRNDTGFPLRLSEYVKSIRAASSQGSSSQSTYPFLKYYQNIVRIVLSGVDMNTRGLLIDHEMGLGKSILAVAAAIDMMPDRQPIILLAKSLAENMRGSIIKYVKMRAEYDAEWPIGRFSPAELDAWISANFSFVSMNASNMLAQIGRAVSLDKKIGDILEQVSSLDGKLLIVDESHNLFRAIVNGSKNGLGLYQLVQKSKNLKIIFLTGTPIANDPFELVPCFNMLGSDFSSGKQSGGSVLPEDYIEFNRLYVDENGRLKNREKFQNRLFGLVSSIKYKWLSANEPRGEFPERLPLITVRVRMDHVQYTSYSLAREKEKEEGNRPGRGGANVRVALVKPKSKGSSTYRVKSRQLGNFDPTADSIDEIELPSSPKFLSILANIDRHPNQKGLVYSQFVGMGGLTPFRKFLDNHGWTEMVVGQKAPADLSTYMVSTNTASTNTASTYMDDLNDTLPAKDSANATNMSADSGITSEALPVVATTDMSTEPVRSILGSNSALPSAMDYIEQMISGAGESSTGWWLGGDQTSHDNIKQSEYDITAMMETSFTPGPPDTTSYTLPPDTTSYTAALDTADTTDTTDTNDTTVKSGGNYVIISGDIRVEDRTRVQEMFNDPSSGCDLIIVSSTGAEGLDLKRIRHIHIMEPYWNWGRIDQIISRGVRNDSHIDLPADQKNVQSYIYLAVPPESEDDGSPTTDVELYEDALKNRDSIDSFLDALDEVSIECTLDERKCRICNPTGEPLYSNDPTQDVRTRDTCTAHTNQEVQASEIVIDEKTYHYTSSPESVYGIKIFEFDQELGAYKMIKESNPLYQRVYTTINPETE
jgi:Helicase conserved C-terminal domain